MGILEGGADVVAGMLISILAGTPVGSTIVAVDVLVFAVAYFIGKVTGGKA